MSNSFRRMNKLIWSGVFVVVVLLSFLATSDLFATGEGSGVLERSTGFTSWIEGASSPSASVANFQVGEVACADLETSMSRQNTVSQQNTVPGDPRTQYLPLIMNCPPVTPTPMPTPTLDPWTDPGVPIEVFSPVEGAIYHSPIEIIGFSQTFEGNVIVQLKDANGEVIGERATIGGSVDGHDFFHTRLRFVIDVEPGEVMSGTVEILHEVMTEERSEQDKVTIPVLLQQGQRRIDVDSPRTGEEVCAPAFISGYSNTFEANVVIRLSQRDGTVVEEKPTMGGTFGFYEEFSASFEHEVSEPQPMLVSAHEIDAGGLGNIDHTRVPISLYACP